MRAEKKEEPSVARENELSASSSIEKLGLWTSFKDSFKPAIKTETLTHEIAVDEEELTDVQRAALKASNSQLSRSLKSRHLQMIAIGSSIGTGLFVGSGSALRTGGSAGLIIAWTLILT